MVSLRPKRDLAVTTQAREELMLGCDGSQNTRIPSLLDRVHTNLTETAPLAAQVKSFWNRSRL